MNLQQHKPPDPWYLVILFFMVSSVVIIGGYLYYKNQEKILLFNTQKEMSAISDLKIRQITQWRLDRMGNASFLGENTILVKMISKFLENPKDILMQDNLFQFFKSLTDNFDYKEVVLLDTSGSVKLSYPVRDEEPEYFLEPLLPDIIKDRRITLTDLNKTGSAKYVHLDLLVPLVDFNADGSYVAGLLDLIVDPSKVLYPLIQSWPTPSKTAETLLLRKDGNDIVFLNELRHIKNTELLLRKPITTERLPAAMAVQGIEGTINGIDYRNVPVVASMKKIPGTSWFMVAKIDREEIISSLKNRMKMVLIIILLFILALGLFLGFFSWNQRARFYREKYEDELNRLALIKHFDYILKFANDIIFLIDKDLRIVEANDRALESYMYTREEFIGMKLEDIRAPEAIKQIPQQLEIVEENEYATFETFHKRRDNTVFPVEVSVRVVNIEGSKYYQTIGRDITERKSVENTLKESEEKFRKIFEESPFCMLITAKDFEIVRANLSFCKMTGYEESELKLLTFKDFTHPDHIVADELSLLKLVAGKIPVYQTEKRYIRKDGSIIWGSTTVSLIRNNNDEVQFFLVMIEDITLRKRTEAELIAAKEKAEENDRLKTAFLHNISHEIRTPMNAIIGFSTLLGEPDLEKNDQQQYVDIIGKSSNQLLSIINDIVDIANVESGQAKMNFKTVNLNSMLQSLSKQFSYKGREQNIPINVRLGLPDEEAVINTDATKLIQILSNLINNALKFTRQGNIDFGYILKDDYLEFTVSETGIGIPAHHLDRIFDRFYQVSGTVSRQYGGTGLGLSICKAYVELFGGKIWVESKEGEGTSFYFNIPYNRA
jgi:PAS domain S-box-containing protein